MYAIWTNESFAGCFGLELDDVEAGVKLLQLCSKMEATLGLGGDELSVGEKVEEKVQHTREHEEPSKLIELEI